MDPDDEGGSVFVLASDILTIFQFYQIDDEEDGNY